MALHAGWPTASGGVPAASKQPLTCAALPASVSETVLSSTLQMGQEAGCWAAVCSRNCCEVGGSAAVSAAAVLTTACCRSCCMFMEGLVFLRDRGVLLRRGALLARLDVDGKKMSSSLLLTEASILQPCQKGSD